MNNIRYIPTKDATKIPKTPGVYLFYGKKGILYIGKAINLNARVRSHFARSTYRDNMFIEQTTRVGYIELASEIEALILESQLIKKHLPRYNVLLKDDKQYFYVEFTNETYTRIIVTHQPKSIASKNIVGPFTDGKSLKTVLRYLRKAFPYYTPQSSLRSPRGKLQHRKLPCSYCHIGLCPGPNPDIKEYKKNIVKIKNILNGKKPRVLSALKKDMLEFSKKHDYERAAKARDQIKALENIFSHNFKVQISNDKSSPKPKYQSHISGLKFGFSHLDFKPIEAYDISNIQGREPVASMVRFDNGRPNKSLYRKFKIRLPEKPDDFAMMREVIRRRLTHPEWPYPDLFLIDGGKGQLSSALSSLREFETDNPKTKIKIASIAKRFNELFVQDQKKSVPLDSLPENIKNLLMHARDEAHRFAINYHRKLHRKTFK